MQEGIERLKWMQIESKLNYFLYNDCEALKAIKRKKKHVKKNVFNFTSTHIQRGCGAIKYALCVCLIYFDVSRRHKQQRRKHSQHNISYFNECYISGRINMIDYRIHAPQCTAPSRQTWNINFAFNFHLIQSKDFIDMTHTVVASFWWDTCSLKQILLCAC